jgi:hypothetical protein
MAPGAWSSVRFDYAPPYCDAAPVISDFCTGALKLGEYLGFRNSGREVVLQGSLFDPDSDVRRKMEAEQARREQAQQEQDRQDLARPGRSTL